MIKKHHCLPALMLASLMVFDYCEAADIFTSNPVRQAAIAQITAVQNDNASTSTKLHPKETASRLLPKQRGDTLHIAFEKGYIGNGVMLEPVLLKEAYAIEVIVRPSAQQVPFAAILSNHRVGTIDGFTVQQAYKEQNIYYMCFGDGSEWSSSANFKLNAGVWNYVAIVFGEGKSLSVYVDGSLAGTVVTANTIKDNFLPLQIGNAAEGGRPFSGDIAEIRIAAFPLGEKEIERRWSKLKLRLPKM